MSNTLIPMGVGEPETVRCRIYDGTTSNKESAADAKRLAFVRACASREGAVDCEAYDPWVEALQKCGWLPEKPRLIPNPKGEGRVGRWHLTAKGREETRDIR